VAYGDYSWPQQPTTALGTWNSPVPMLPIGAEMRLAALEARLAAAELRLAEAEGKLAALVSS
jgi:hypothetical protein